MATAIYLGAWAIAMGLGAEPSLGTYVMAFFLIMYDASRILYDD